MVKEKKKKNWKELQRTRQTRQQQSQEAFQSRMEQTAKNKPKKLPKGKIFLAICLIAVVLSAFGAWQGLRDMPNPSQVPSATPGAPDFSMADLNGTQFSLSQYRGKPIVVHFMALAGCSGALNPISYDRLPELVSLRDRYSDKVAMVTVCVATCAGCDTILAGVRDNYGISWIMGNDYADERLEIVEAYLNLGKELYDGSVVLVDKSFKVEGIYSPNATLSVISSRLDQLL